MRELTAFSSVLGWGVMPSLTRRPCCSLGAAAVAGAVALGLIHDTILSHRFGSGEGTVFLEPDLSLTWLCALVTVPAIP